MSFGCGIGDVVLLTQLARKTHKACKDAPPSFPNLAQETQSLHAILQEIEEILRYSHTKVTRAQQCRLQGITDGCRSVLVSLDAVLQNYESLGTQNRMTWDRMGYATEDIAKIRSRLKSHALLLSSFIQTSQVVVEQKLRKLIKEVQEGKHDGSQLSVRSFDTKMNERKRWRTIRKQLEAVGITIAAFEENLAFIIDYMKDAIASGALEKKARDPIPLPAMSSLATTEKPSNPRIGPRKLCSYTPKKFPAYWKRRTPVLQTSAIQEQRWNKNHKISLLGISEAGKTTVLNQIRLLSSPNYDPGEYNDCRMLLWNTLMDNFVLVLDELPEEIFDESCASRTRSKSSSILKGRFKAKFKLYAAPRLVSGNETFPIDVMDAVHALWNEPAVHKVIDRSAEVGLSENLEYLYKNMERIGHPWDTPNNDDILNIRVKTLGVAETIIEFDQEIYRIFDVPGERAGRRKWKYCFEGDPTRCVAVVASLTGYCSFVESRNTDENQLDETLLVLESFLTSKWFPEGIFVLFLTKLDVFRKTMRNFPLENYDAAFSESSSNDDSAAHGLAFIANKFVALAKKHNRILQVHCINATSPISQECLKAALRIISCTPSQPSNGTGRLIPCSHCQMGELFNLDHFEVPSEPLDFKCGGEEKSFPSMWKDDEEDLPPYTDNSRPSSMGELVGARTSPDGLDSTFSKSTPPLDWRAVQVKDEVQVKSEVVTESPV